MSKTHHLKTWPVPFDAVMRGDKTFEVRKNDRGYQTGDTLILEEFDPTKAAQPAPTLPSGYVGVKPHMTPGFAYDERGNLITDAPLRDAGYTGRTCEVVVSYVLQGGAFGLALDHCVMAIERLERVQDEVFPASSMPRWATDHVNCRCVVRPTSGKTST